MSPEASSPRDPDMSALVQLALRDSDGAILRALSMNLRVPLSSGERDIVRWILQPWWEMSASPISMARHAGKVADAEGFGSVGHLRAARIALRCARNVVHLVEPPVRDMMSLLVEAEDALGRGDREGLEGLSLAAKDAKDCSRTNTASHDAISSAFYAAEVAAFHDVDTSAARCAYLSLRAVSIYCRRVMSPSEARRCPRARRRPPERRSPRPRTHRSSSRRRSVSRRPPIPYAPLRIGGTPPGRPPARIPPSPAQLERLRLLRERIAAEEARFCGCDGVEIGEGEDVCHECGAHVGGEDH